MKIVLIKPPYSSKEEFGDMSYMGSCEPPLGLCCLAAVLRENSIDVEIIDSIALKIGFEETVNKAVNNNPMFVGFSAETPTICNAAKLAEMIKRKRPDITTIIGGTHISALPEKTMESFPQLDIGVIGEGEMTLLELLNTLSNGRDVRNVRGLVIRRNNKPVMTDRRESIKCLDSLPVPAWDLLPFLPHHYYLSFYSVRKTPSISLVTSRGCGFKCSFCYQGVFGRKVRRHSAAYVMNMIRDLYHNYGIREIRFQDDIFLSDENRLVTLCEMLINENLDISWSCLSSVEKIKKETLSIMKKAGCWQILLGIESGSQVILREIKKNVRLSQIESGLRLIHDAGIRSVGYFMIGYPAETRDTIKETIKFARKMPIDDFRMNYLVPFPGTEIHSVASRTGILNKDWNEMNFFKGPCFVPEKLSKKDIIYYRRLAYFLFYFRPGILLSYLSMVFTRPSFITNYLRGGWILIKYFSQITTEHFKLKKTTPQNIQNS